MKWKEEGEQPSTVYADSGNEFELYEWSVYLHILKTFDYVCSIKYLADLSFDFLVLIFNFELVS